MKTMMAIAVGSLLAVWPITSTDPECAGCSGDFEGFGSNTPCVTITMDSPGDAEGGTCNPNDCPKGLTNCVLEGKFTITNTGAGGCPTEVSVRSRVNGGCGTGTTVLRSGESVQISLEGDELSCGTEYHIRVYVNASPTGCSALGEAFIKYLCGGCYPPHGG